MRERILVIDDEESLRFTFESFLSDEGYRVAVARDYHEALARMDEQDFDLIFADIILQDKSGIDVLQEIRGRNLTCPVVLITGYPDLETASEAIRLGAFDYLTKPVQQEKLLHVTHLALRYKTLEDEKEKYRTNLEAIFHSVKDSIITVDRDMNVVELNRAAMEMCRLARDAIGKGFPSLAKGCNGKCVDVLKETIRSRKPIEVARLECHLKGRPRYVVNLSSYPLLDSQGRFSGAVLVFKDETRLADLEEELQERQEFHHMVGKSEEMQKIYTLIEALANVGTTVLVTGESGTGKELVVEALHHRGERRHKPLVKVNCSALPESLLESELFGHVKGAFTGAAHDKTGRFELAHGGTIFLDEIGDLCPKIQLDLLRVIQERTFERVGDHTPIKVDVRVVAATNQDLPEKVRTGQFRKDLYYRLKVVEVNLPPLRERRQDIPLLVDHFLNKFKKRFNQEIEAVSADVQEILMEHPWPGNVRELEHTIEHAFVLCRQNIITVEHLPAEFRNYLRPKVRAVHVSEDDESQAILRALERAAWNKTKAARILGIDRRTLYRKMERYNIPPKPL